MICPCEKVLHTLLANFQSWRVYEIEKAVKRCSIDAVDEDLFLFALSMLVCEHGIKIRTARRQDYLVGREISIVNTEDNITKIIVISESFHAAEEGWGMIIGGEKEAVCIYVQ